MRDFDVYHYHEKVASVTIHDTHVDVIRYVYHPVKQIFPKDRLTRYEFGEVLRLRCWDESRVNLDKYLRKLGLDEFNIYKICEKTHGVRKNDYIWFKFDGEDICAEDLLCLK